MIPFFSVDYQECEYCQSEIYIGYEAIYYDNCLFCDNECLMNHVAELSGAKAVYLTDDKMYRSVD